MKIETKFSVGQTVYCIGRDRRGVRAVDSGAYIIDRIKIDIATNSDTGQNELYVNYAVRPKLHPCLSAIWSYEQYTFASFKEAQEALKINHE